MPRKNLLSLHESIVIALININPKTRTETFQEVEDFIIERNFSPIRDGNIPLSEQIMLRSKKSSSRYLYLFEQLNETTIRLRNVHCK